LTDHRARNDRIRDGALVDHVEGPADDVPESRYPWLHGTYIGSSVQKINAQMLRK
jgi:hypothetical protein